MLYCTSYFKFLFDWCWGVPEQNKDFTITTYGGTHFLSATCTRLRPLNRISWNFQELFTTWCHTAPPILSFYLTDFGVSQSKTRTLPFNTWWSGGFHFVSIAHSISSLHTNLIHFAFYVSMQACIFVLRIYCSLLTVLKLILLHVSLLENMYSCIFISFASFMIYEWLYILSWNSFLNLLIVLPCPRELTLDHQLTNSIVISWKPPCNHSHLDVKSYHVYVDGVFKSLVRKNERMKALLEDVDSKEVSSLGWILFLLPNPNFGILWIKQLLFICIKHKK